MFQDKRFVFIFLTFLLLIHCQPQLVKKQPAQKSTIDSVFFYQKKDVPDPFIDGLLSIPDQPVVLKQKIAPAARPLTFKEIEGFRVQVLASVDSFNALQVARKLKHVVQDSIHLVHEKNLFKVQVGDFPYRTQADSLRQLLRQQGFSGAWTVQRSILIPQKTPEAAPSAKNVEIKSELLAYYQIQVFATSDAKKAQRIVDQLSLRFEFPCEYKEQNGLFKVVLGRFATRDQAEMVLKEVKNLGFKDAWIVHKP